MAPPRPAPAGGPAGDLKRGPGAGQVQARSRPAPSLRSSGQSGPASGTARGHRARGAEPPTAWPPSRTAARPCGHSDRGLTPAAGPQSPALSRCVPALSRFCPAESPLRPTPTRCVPLRPRSVPYPSPSLSPLHPRSVPPPSLPLSPHFLAPSLPLSPLRRPSVPARRPPRCRAAPPGRCSWRWSWGSGRAGCAARWRLPTSTLSARSAATLSPPSRMTAARVCGRCPCPSRSSVPSTPDST